MRAPMHTIVALLVALTLLAMRGDASAFTLIGPFNPNNTQLTLGNNYYSFQEAIAADRPWDGVNALPAATSTQSNEQLRLNFYDPMGWPVTVKEFYRWQYPELTYSFDSTFIRYFGTNGMQAVHNAFEVLNDYFEPQDKAYSGVSSLNLRAEYDKRHASWRYNPSADAANVTDIESMVLGLLVNQMGLGNPHRYCFVIRDINNLTATTADFHIEVRNYDPYTYRPTSWINGVNYSYFIMSSGPLAPGVVVRFDAFEYSVFHEPEEFSAVAGIRDSITFTGQTPWAGGLIQPTVFRNWGIFFTPDDPLTKPQPENYQSRLRTQPRHALTLDDAGGLRYLYRTNNVVWEALAPDINLVKLADMNPRTIPKPNTQLMTLPGFAQWPNQSRTIAPAAGAGIAPARTPLRPTQVRPNVTTIVRLALRGGIDKIQFRHQAFDSLLGNAFEPHTTMWADTFITNFPASEVPSTTSPYFQQVVSRTVTAPDIVFIAEDLGLAAGGPVHIQTPDMTGWETMNVQALISQNGTVPGGWLGPGRIRLPGGAGIQYMFTTRAPYFEVPWDGDPGEAGSLVPQFQWGWITNTGPNDYMTFPLGDTPSMLEGLMGPAQSPPVILQVEVYDEASKDYEIAPFVVDRSQDLVILTGSRLDSAHTIQIMDANSTRVGGGYTVLQSIEARRYIMSDQQIIIPGGVLNDKTVSATDATYRRVSVVNSKGESNSEFVYRIVDGRPVIHSTDYDAAALNTRKSLTIRGSGFVSSLGKVNQLWIFDDNDNANYVQDPVPSAGTFPQPIAILDINSSRTSFINSNGALVDYGSLRVEDDMIYIPADFISSGNYTLNRFGVLGNGTLMARSEGNSSDNTVNLFSRHIRLAINSDASGQPNSDVILSPSRARTHGFTHVGVGGDRNSTLSALSGVRPTITEVFTNSNVPGPPTLPVDANRTWARTNAADILTIRGVGLDLAQSFEFVDQTGQPLLTVDAVTGLPPGWIELRQIGISASALRTGVTILPYPLLGRDGYEIQIDPVAVGMNTVSLFDTGTGNNVNQLRRIVVHTPFGTVIAPPNQFLRIQN